MKTLGTFIWQTLDWISFLTGPDPKHFSAGRGQQKAWKHRMMAADLVKTQSLEGVAAASESRFYVAFRKHGSSCSLESLMCYGRMQGEVWKGRIDREACSVGVCREMMKRVVQLHKPGDKPEVKGSCSPGGEAAATLVLELHFNTTWLCESFTNRTGAAGSSQAEKNINVCHTCIIHTYCCLAVRVCRMETGFSNWQALV